MRPLPADAMVLRCGSDDLGHVVVDGCENFHICGYFRPGPEFEKYRSLFEKATSLSEVGGDAWFDALEDIDSLGLTLFNPRLGTAQPIRDFQSDGCCRLSDHGERIEFKFARA